MIFLPHLQKKFVGAENKKNHYRLWFSSPFTNKFVGAENNNILVNGAA